MNKDDPVIELLAAKALVTAAARPPRKRCSCNDSFPWRRPPDRSRAIRADYRAFVAWLPSPITDILMVMLLIALFCHAALGLQVVIEHYVHSGTRFAAVIVLRLAYSAFTIVDIRAILHIAADS